MDMSMARVEPRRRDSTYLYVTDEMGDMCVGIADMDIAECVTPEHLASCIDRINSADALVLDTNLSAEAIRFLAAACTVPIYSDPVSTAKAMKPLPVLDRIYALKPNALEARYLTGEAEPEKAAERFLEMGVKRVFISLGTEGMLYASADGIGRVPCRLCECDRRHRSGRRRDGRHRLGRHSGLQRAEVRRRRRESGRDRRRVRIYKQPRSRPQALI